LEINEINGISQYEKGNYEAAFNLLKEPAAWGYKGSQYALAFMFLKGNYVEQSTLLGMGWLGVANEADVKEWQAQYNLLYSTAAEKQKLEIDLIVAEYILRYGLKSQDITCTKRINASRRPEMKCHAYGGLVLFIPLILLSRSN
jgi:TPR repeat protein